MQLKKMTTLAMTVLAGGYMLARPFSATPFADNMVLQRERPVPVWGAAAPGERVSVSFAGQTKETTADKNGAWRVTLDPMKASKESRTLKITGADGAEEFKNVLVGEVWFASGQSNMECPIWGGNPRYRDGNGLLMVSTVRKPFVRYVKNARRCTRYPDLKYKALWRDFSPESFKATMNKNLSALAFYYALELYNALDVPVGVVDSSWGGTRIEPWTPSCAYPKGYAVPAKFNRGTPTTLWNGMVAAWAPMAIRGFIWYQGCANAADGAAYCDKMHRLYDGWSKAFDNSDLKLYFVQLAPYSRNWFQIQLAQARFAAEEKNAALVPTCDLGNLHDIHPNLKEPIARRLALCALKRDYGFTHIVDAPPTLKSWKIEKGAFVLSFDNAASWYAYNNDRSAAKGFEIAGATGPFVPAKIVNPGANNVLKGRELIVKAEGITEPRRLRYLSSNPWHGSLYSADSSLPLGPFEIDARNPADNRRAEAGDQPGDALKIPEIEGFRAVFAADLPARAFSGYSLDKSAQAGSFNRVAYVLELGHRDGTVDWVVAVMDAFSGDVAMLGVPAASKATFQRKVSNLAVRSNVKSVTEGVSASGGIVEFFNVNYAKPCGLAGAGGSAAKYDINDSAATNGDYGCMQIHDLSRGSTILAYNRFNKDGVADIGIGSNLCGENPDWTFAENAADYAFRRLTILVK